MQTSSLQRNGAVAVVRRRSISGLAGTSTYSLAADDDDDDDSTSLDKSSKVVFSEGERRSSPNARRPSSSSSSPTSSPPAPTKKKNSGVRVNNSGNIPQRWRSVSSVTTGTTSRPRSSSRGRNGRGSRARRSSSSRQLVVSPSPDRDLDASGGGGGGGRRCSSRARRSASSRQLVVSSSPSPDRDSAAAAGGGAAAAGRRRSSRVRKSGSSRQLVASPSPSPDLDRDLDAAAAAAAVDRSTGISGKDSRRKQNIKSPRVSGRSDATDSNKNKIPTTPRRSNNRVRRNGKNPQHYFKRHASMSTLPVGIIAASSGSEDDDDDDDNGNRDLKKNHGDREKRDRLVARSMSLSRIDVVDSPKNNSKVEKDNCDHDDMPPLLDFHEEEQEEKEEKKKTSSGVRKSGKKWQILDDRPNGHTPDKLSIVPGVDETGQMKRKKYEYDAVVVSPAAVDDASLDEADDILDDEEDDNGDDNNDHPITFHHESSDDDDSKRAPQRAQMTLPSDPRCIDEVYSSPTISRKKSLDRFNPSFQSNSVWSPTDQGDVVKDDEAQMILDPDVSLVSYNDLGHHSFDFSQGQSVSVTVDEQQIEGEQLPAENKDLSEDEHDEIVEDEDGNFSFFTGSGVGTTLDPSSRWESQKPKSTREVVLPQRKNSIRKIGESAPRTTDRANPIKASSHSSKLKSGVPRKKRASRNRIPSVVHSGTMGSRSPISTTFTKTPSSTRPSSLKNLSEFIETTVPFRDDEHTHHSMGASTITTNFSTTQRTQGTLQSTRSLFQSSNNNCGADIMKIPERWRGDSDVEEETDAEDDADDDDQKFPNSQRSLNQLSPNEVSCVHTNFDMLQSSDSPKIEPANIVRNPSGDDGDGLIVENSWSSSQTSAA
eukprot:CAMPEP_0113471378 /NCGR_PEP_ID=MMETSP0014_2-20120614/16944_1 /TAXON_ID=2857 /ORGANISM="Nitzschia sp." /LENGTH=878 /DNA_ID=CAMNT_0000364005 /DNA_START=83 /DNA_END=2716 /DNA_ORIENTATION=- /assembly_acc=CAM_ASM_000159